MCDAGWDGLDCSTSVCLAGERANQSVVEIRLTYLVLVSPINLTSRLS